MIRFNANLFRIAMLCASDEETRYYLKGAYIEPHAVKGVTLITTDGHKLLALHDEDGFADESAIIALTPAALKACKPGRHERRDVVIAGISKDATVCTVLEYPERDENTNAVTGRTVREDTPVAFSPACRVDGTYPDYRRVFPQPIAFSENSQSPSFSTLVIDALSGVALELAKHYTDAKVAPRSGIMRINASDRGSPALVTFPAKFKAVAVAMPMRGEIEAVVPEWFTANVAAQMQEAAE